MIPSPKKESPDSAKIDPPTPKVNEIKKIGAKIGAKYLNMILKVETFESLNESSLISMLKEKLTYGLYRRGVN